MEKTSLLDIRKILSDPSRLQRVSWCRNVPLRNTNLCRIVVPEELMLKWLSFGLLFFSCVQIQERGFSLLFGHSSMMDLGRQVEHMAAPPMTGGLLLWRRRSGTAAKSFCLVTS